MSTATDFVYSSARKALGQGTIDLLTADVRAMLVTSGYTPSPNTDQYVSAVGAGNIVVRDVALTGKTFSVSGGFSGNIPGFNALVSTLTVVAVILYIYNASDSLAQLLYYSSGGTGFPFVPQGFDYTVSYDQSSGGWFQA